MLGFRGNGYVGSVTEADVLLFSLSSSEQTADDADDAVGHKSFMSAAMQTGFCDWSAKYFAQPVMKV